MAPRMTFIARRQTGTMLKTTVRALLILFLTIGGSVAAFAQNGEAPDADVFVGYSLLNVNVDRDSAAVHGFDASVTGHVNNWFGITGEVSGHYESGDAIHYVQGGPRVTFRSDKSRVEPFAHALFGGTFFNSTGRFSMALGGGVDVRVNDRVSIRAIQADYAPVYFDHFTMHNARIATGVVFRFD